MISKRTDSDRKRLMKYFRTYFILTLVLAICLCSFVYLFSEKLMKDSIDETGYSSFSLLKHSHDTIFSQLEYTTRYLFESNQYKDFMEYYDRGSYSKMNEVIKNLNQIKASMPIIENICIYYPSHEYTLSYRQSVASVYSCHDSAFLLSLTESNPLTYRTYVRQVQYYFSTPTTVVTLVRPLSYSKVNGCESFVTIDLSFDTISKAFRDFVPATGSSLLIYSDSGTLISSLGRIYDYKTISSAMEVPGEEITSADIKLDGEHLRVYNVSNPSFGWTYFYVINADVSTMKLGNLRLIIVSLFAAISLIGIVYSWSQSKRLTKPLDAISKRIGSPDVDIYERIDSLIEQNAKISMELTQNLVLGSENQALHRMLTGIDSGMEPDGVPTLRLHEGETECAFFLLNMSSEKSVSMESLNHTLAAYGMRVMMKLYTDTHEIALLTASSGFETEKIRSSAKALQRIYGDEGDISVGVSKPFTSHDMLSEAYLQASMALGMRMVRGRGSVCGFLEIRNHVPPTYPYGIEMDLLKAFKQSDRNGILSSVGTFEKLLIDADASMHTVQDHYLQMFCTCQRLSLDMKSDVSEVIGAYSHHELLSLDYVGDMSTYIVNMLIAILDALENPADTGVNDLIGRVCDYIDSHLGDMVSLEALAHEFFMSPSALRTEFGRVMNMTIKAYTDKKRLEVAKEMLKNSNAKLQDIASAVGFSYAQSFIPFFKNATGMTPGEYRQSMRMNEINRRADEK